MRPERMFRIEQAGALPDSLARLIDHLIHRARDEYKLTGPPSPATQYSASTITSVPS